jgi:hypothetical protein
MKKLFLVLIICLSLLLPVVASANMECLGEPLTDGETNIVNMVHELLTAYGAYIIPLANAVKPEEVLAMTRPDLQRLATQLTEEGLLQVVSGQIGYYEEGDVWMFVIVEPTLDKEAACIISVMLREKTAK